MKKYEFYDQDEAYTLVVGTDREIRSLYTNLERHDYMPTFSKSPKFREGGMYGLILESDHWFHVVGADTVIRLLMDKEG